MRYVKDLYKHDGSPIPFSELAARGIKGHHLIKWMGLIGKVTTLRYVNNQEQQHGTVELTLRSGQMLMFSNSKVIYNQVLSWKTGDEVHIPKVANYLQNSDNVDLLIGSLCTREETMFVLTRKPKNFSIVLSMTFYQIGTG